VFCPPPGGRPSSKRSRRASRKSNVSFCALLTAASFTGNPRSRAIDTAKSAACCCDRKCSPHQPKKWARPSATVAATCRPRHAPDSAISSATRYCAAQTNAIVVKARFQGTHDLLLCSRGDEHRQHFSRPFLTGFFESAIALRGARIHVRPVIQQQLDAGGIGIVGINHPHKGRLAILVFDIDVRTRRDQKPPGLPCEP